MATLTLDVVVNEGETPQCVADQLAALTNTTAQVTGNTPAGGNPEVIFTGERADLEYLARVYNDCGDSEDGPCGSHQDILDTMDMIQD
jgi:hypothetical protein